ncbi:uncharacterized protein LOC106697657 isoform X2 [Myotis lucifugus]|uniref:uncharacterized protein LOC106697657 isoform X2 n=1 Tax=Myotis lucifugus TaxID=59463 RepID=UPI000CCC86B3|nr:uncharacterized protein LOC106697657 isoform X2 [Myotis lucifugus]
MRLTAPPQPPALTMKLNNLLVFTVLLALRILSSWAVVDAGKVSEELFLLLSLPLASSLPARVNLSLSLGTPELYAAVPWSWLILACNGQLKKPNLEPAPSYTQQTVLCMNLLNATVTGSVQRSRNAVLAFVASNAWILKTHQSQFKSILGSVQWSLASVRCSTPETNAGMTATA